MLISFFLHMGYKWDNWLCSGFPGPQGSLEAVFSISLDYKMSKCTDTSVHVVFTSLTLNKDRSGEVKKHVKLWHNQFNVLPSISVQGCLLLLYSRSVEPNPLWPQGLQHTRLPCPWHSQPSKTYRWGRRQAASPSQKPSGSSRSQLSTTRGPSHGDAPTPAESWGQGPWPWPWARPAHGGHLRGLVPWVEWLQKTRDRRGDACSGFRYKRHSRSQVAPRASFIFCYSLVQSLALLEKPQFGSLSDSVWKS